MKEARHRTLGFLGIVALALGAAVAPVAGQIPDPLVPGRAVVRLLDGIAIGDFVAQFEADHVELNLNLGVAPGGDALAPRRIYLLEFDDSGLTEQQLDQLEVDFQTGYPAHLLWGELLYEGHNPEDNTGSLWFHTVGGSAAVASQYAGVTLDLGAAQSRSTGQGVVVAILDTGLDVSHPLLAPHIAPGGFNFVTGNDNVADANGHGTFVAGLVNLVAPDAQLLPVVVLGTNGVGDLWTLARGMFYAVDSGAEVINLSLGSTYNSRAVEDALEEAKSGGIAVTAAGGNWGLGEADREEFPAAGSNSFGVAAVDDLDVKADFSNYNSKFVISAPGTSAPLEGAPDGFDPDRTIYSTLPVDQGAYGIWEGTSFSTAFVSGTAALLHAQHPEWPHAETTQHHIEAILVATAVDIDGIPANATYAGQLGAGRLATGAAIALGAGDLDLDGTVGILDFLSMLAAWGPCPPGADCLADLNADGTVNVLDVLILLASWD
jgi:subtilisin family serine protease